LKWQVVHKLVLQAQKQLPQLLQKESQFIVEAVV
jgi:hypothetical protein